MIWTAASFSLYILKYYTKYLEGGIFVNQYLDGMAGLVGYFIANPLYPVLRTQLSFVLGFSVMLVGSILVLCSTMDALPAEKETVMPWLAFTAKVGSHMVFSTAYLAGYSNQVTFPLLKRA